ncbi:hypothetical protein AB0N09_34690 [Streptomyces erythrochromogenes]|uniref:hypothetical protein n=1 Tax=Streptomyces erythrochromogenes TaxID=285574 RepID=UPI00343BF25C
MQDSSCCASLFRDLVEKARVDAGQLVGTFSDAMYQQFREGVDGEQAARNRYLELAFESMVCTNAVRAAKGEFLDVCEDVLALHEGFARDVDQALGLTGTPGGARGPVFEVPDADDLLVRIQDVARSYADHVAAARDRLDASWQAFAGECSTQLTAFRDIAVRDHGVPPGVLDAASAAEAAEAEPAATLAAATVAVVTVAAVTTQLTTVRDVVEAAPAVWDYFTDGGTQG